ncbi:MAG: GDSL-type esterase/lipase family protein [Kiritimatiellae bacterium]|nr:GDSL-type esterase/lipase family protein [Kiritimatiellia bacterium]
MHKQQPLTGLAAATAMLLCSTITGQAGEACKLSANLRAGRQQTVVAYGTSLTAGGAWVAQLSAELARRFPGLATVINSGKGAMWSQWGVDNLEDRILSKKPDTVLIEFSINDAYLPYKTSVAQARTNLETIVNRILAANPACEIILMVMNPPTGIHLENRPNIESYNQMYRECAARRGLMLIDHYPKWSQLLKSDPKQFSAYVPDGIHPNAEGCMQVITPAIIEALGLPAQP